LEKYASNFDLVTRYYEHHGMILAWLKYSLSSKFTINEYKKPARFVFELTLSIASFNFDFIKLPNFKINI